MIKLRLVIFNGKDIEEIVYESGDNDFKRACDFILNRQHIIINNIFYVLEGRLIRIEKI